MDFLNRILDLVRQKKAILLDVRSPEEYCAYHLPGAILIPTPHPPLSAAQQDRLEQNLMCVLRPYQSTQTLIFVYCKKGIRAKQAQQLIRSLGFPRVISLGGITELPLVDLIEHIPALETCDFGNGSTHFNIEDITNENKAFRHVIATPGNLQLVVMSLLPGQDIGMEKHPHIDQFIRVENGQGMAMIRGARNFTVPLVPGDALIIQHNDWHNIWNTGKGRLNLYTIYAPPSHAPHLTQFRKHKKL